MPETASDSMVLGTFAPDVRLPDATGTVRALSDQATAPALLVAVLSNRCAFVVGIREAFAELARRNAPRGLQVIAINSNDAVAHPEETPERNATEVDEQGYVRPSPPQGRGPVGRSRLRGSLHARPLPLRCGAPARLPRPVRRLQARQRGARDGRGPAARDRCAADGQAAARAPGALGRLQRQVACRSDDRNPLRRGAVRPSRVGLPTRAAFLGPRSQTTNGPQA